MRSRLSRVTLLCTAGLAVFAVACSEDNGVAPRSRVQPQAPSLSFSQSGTPSGTYIIQTKTFGSTGSVASTVAAMGGTISRNFPEIGYISVNGLSAAQASKLPSLNTNVSSVNADRSLQWVPAIDGSNQLANVDESSLGLGATGTNQTGAAFYNAFQWGLKVIQAPTAWTNSPGGAGTLVCVLDTGVDPGHLDLNGKVNTGVSISESTDSSFAGNQTIFDYNFHGTFVSSIISSNGIGVASTAPDTKLCAVKVLGSTGSGSFNDVIAGIIYATNIHANVINMSLGAYFDVRQVVNGMALVHAMQAAVDYANQHGTVVVAASGNNGVNLDADPNDIVSLPAQLKGVISVGATGPINQQNFDLLASYSNYGGVTGVALVAPGGSGNPVVQADEIIGACSRFALTFNCTSGRSYLIGVGTSFASPHVAGASAVLMSKYPGLHTTTVRRCLTTQADVIGPSATFGAGRLNEARTVLSCSP